MKYRWISWYHKKDYSNFELHNPWWYSGIRLDDDADTVCAAIPTLSDREAKKIIRKAYDKPPKNIEWRFNNLKDGSPFNDRFEKAKWMKWPRSTRKRRKPRPKIITLTVDGEDKYFLFSVPNHLSRYRLKEYKKLSNYFLKIIDWHEYKRGKK